MNNSDLHALMEGLADCFGGHSMVHPENVGDALAGRMINSGGTAPTLETLAAWHFERWGDNPYREEGEDEEWAREVLLAMNKRLESQEWSR